MTIETTYNTDTHDMVVVHRLFRRESGVVIDLIAAVAPGDRARAGVLAVHLRDYVLAVHLHHSGEDELIWPKLLDRLDSGAETVLRMEDEHARLTHSLDQVASTVDAWEVAAGVEERDALVAALVDHRAILIEHLDDEEVNLLPLASRYLSPAEWQEQGAHMAAHTPASKAPLLLGMALEDADPDERELILGGLPAPARVGWETVGSGEYENYVRMIRG
jgi:hemerythrin-like domain-containing protein